MSHLKLKKTANLAKSQTSLWLSLRLARTGEKSRCGLQLKPKQYSPGCRGRVIPREPYELTRKDIILNAGEPEMNPVTRVGILTGGGDCPGLNAVIRAVTKSLIGQHKFEVFGFEDGFLGLIENRYRPLTWDAVSGILQQGGTILGTSNKADPFHYPVTINGRTTVEDYSDQAIENVRALGIEVVVCIGGDGTMTIADQLGKKGLAVVGVPKTIDNDIVGTDITFGYDTAVSIAADAIDRIHTTAQSHHRVMLVEIMGRYAGWLTLTAGLASGADIILIPELEFDLDVVAEKVIERSKKGRRFSIIAVAEGAKNIGGEYNVKRIVDNSPDKIRLGGISITLGAKLEERTGLETRATILGHLQRGGTPTAFDRLLATRYGVAAADLIRNRRFGRMVAMQGVNITDVSIESVAGKMRHVNADHPLIKAALAIGTSLGQ